MINRGKQEAYPAFLMLSCNKNNQLFMGETIVEARHLSHRYATQWAIRDINLEIGQKGILGLLGSNGAGKSTTMNIICGVLNQTEGEVLINGTDLRTDPVEAKKYIGFLPQRPPLYPELSVDEYLTYCARLRQLDAREVRRAVDAAEAKCGITHFKKRLIGNLSGGYQQRVGIAQAIVHNPRFVVLDEPTNGLDPVQIVEVRHLIKEIAAERAVMLSTHILPEVQATCDEIRMIEHGHLVFSGTMEEFNNYAEPASFLVTFGNPPAPEELKNIGGISEVEPLTPREYRVFFTAPAGITQRVIARSMEKGWQLEEIYLERESLDTIFARLSKNSK